VRHKGPVFGPGHNLPCISDVHTFYFEEIWSWESADVESLQTSPCRSPRSNCMAISETEWLGLTDWWLAGKCKLKRWAFYELWYKSIFWGVIQLRRHLLKLARWRHPNLTENRTTFANFPDYWLVELELYWFGLRPMWKRETGMSGSGIASVDNGTVPIISSKMHFYRLGTLNSRSGSFLTSDSALERAQQFANFAQVVRSSIV